MASPLSKLRASEKDMTQGTPWKLILGFFFPLFLGNCFQQVYNLVDTIIVGKGIGDRALAAVGSTGSLHFFIFGFVIGLTNGASIPIAQAYGAKDPARLKKVVGQSALTCISIGLLFSVLSILLTVPLLKLLKTPEDIFPEARLYMQIFCAGLFVTTMYNYASCVLRAIGDSRTPLWSIVISSLTNVVLDILFVVVWHWGVAGAAIATVLAQILSVVFCMLRLRKATAVIPGRGDLKPDFKAMFGLIRLGLPVGFMNSITACGGMLLQYFVNGMGSVYTAAYAVCQRFFAFFEQPGVAIGLSISTYVGQNYGAKNLKRIRIGVVSACIMTLIIGLSLGSLEFFFPDTLTGLMLSDRATIRLCRQLLPYGGMLLWLLNFLFVYRYACLAMSYTTMPMLSGILELVCRVSFCLLLAGRMGFPGITIAEMSAWVGASLFLCVYYHIVMRRLSKAQKQGV